ncbi:MAG TPA: sulfite exporter TauE/SafE family protein [Anaeromyxobacteraceae bacterium]|nr:sulfite exporter TauE/SafE family protein [Anaeromyxobacteraceae bacterium]
MTTLAFAGAAASGALAGALSGVFGIGGGIVLVPLLALVLGLSQHEAQGLTLAVLVLPIGLPAVLAYRRYTVIRWRLVLALVAGFVFGVVGGARAANWLPDKPLRMLFVAFLVAVGVQGWRAHRRPEARSLPTAAASDWHGVWIGVAAGALSGLLGIGGGIVMVPLLVHAARLGRLEAQATSLAAMLPPVGLPGVVVYAAARGGLPWIDLLTVAVSFGAGALAGARLATRASPLTLGRAFSLFVFAVAAALGGTLLWR